MKHQVWGLGTRVRLEIVFGNNLQLQAAITYACNGIRFDQFIVVLPSVVAAHYQRVKSVMS